MEAGCTVLQNKEAVERHDGVCVGDEGTFRKVHLSLLNFIKGWNR